MPEFAVSLFILLYHKCKILELYIISQLATCFNLKYHPVLVNANPTPKEKPATEVTDFSVNLVLNQSPSPPQQYARSKDHDAAEDREEPCAGAAGCRKLHTRVVPYADLPGAVVLTSCPVIFIRVVGATLC